MSFVPEYACETLIGQVLTGERTQSAWIATEMFARKLGDVDTTGGTFSRGYRVESKERQAFMKATDVALLAPSGTSKLEKLNRAIQHQTFERAILDICRGNNMDRIAYAIDYGETEIVFNGVREIVFYIIFDMAQGDVRAILSRLDGVDLSWICHAMHNLSVAVRQLHAVNISHNDIKPSNLLVFDTYLQKLADLGRAVCADHPGPYDRLYCAGDRSYSAPELLYNRGKSPIPHGGVNFDTRRLSDLYLIGSMGYFFATGAMLTPTIVSYLRPEHSPTEWGGTYTQVLPHVRSAYEAAVSHLDAAMSALDPNTPEASDVLWRLRAAIIELTDPDPEFRGHPVDRRSRSDQYDLQRYISLFNLLTETARRRF